MIVVNFVFVLRELWFGGKARRHRAIVICQLRVDY